MKDRRENLTTGTKLQLRKQNIYVGYNDKLDKIRMISQKTLAVGNDEKRFIQRETTSNK